MTDKKQRATLPKTDTMEARNWGDSKETTETLSLTVFDTALRSKRRKAESEKRWHRPDDGFSHPITVRWYMGRSSQASTVYCSVWIGARGEGYYTGRGQAGGYGYHKTSAAFAAAVRSAGITLERDVAGVGDSAVREAITAIGAACGYGRLPQVIS